MGRLWLHVARLSRGRFRGTLDFNVAYCYIYFVKVIYTSTALKQLSGIARKPAQLILAKVDQYATDPASLANQVKKLKGANTLRLRVGSYRVIFTEDGVVLMVVKVGHRGGIYN